MADDSIRRESATLVLDLTDRGCRAPDYARLTLIVALQRVGSQRLTNNPENVEALRARAEIRYILDENAGALADLARLSQLDALEPADILLRYRLNLARTDLEASLEDLNAFLEMVPGNAPALRLRASMLLRLDRLEKAERDPSAARGTLGN